MRAVDRILRVLVDHTSPGEYLNCRELTDLVNRNSPVLSTSTIGTHLTSLSRSGSLFSGAQQGRVVRVNDPGYRNPGQYRWVMEGLISDPALKNSDPSPSETSSPTEKVEASRLDEIIRGLEENEKKLSRALENVGANLRLLRSVRNGATDITLVE